MLRIAILSITCLLPMSTFAQAQFWVPDFATVQKVDAEVANVTFTGFNCPPMKVEEFGRTYGGFIDKTGRREIIGQLVRLRGPSDSKSGVHIALRPISITDGGCGVARVWFDANSLELIQASWGGR